MKANAQKQEWGANCPQIAKLQKGKTDEKTKDTNNPSCYLPRDSKC